jgi:hypothetical protein
MEAILLGTLGFLGNNLNKKNKKNNTNHKPTINKNYNNSINNIVKNQAMQSKTTGYANSFDSIVFDNMNGPVGLNESNIINQNGVPNYNLSLQRDLDFKNDYSEFANTQMHYSVVPTIELMTDNMNPNTTKRDLYQNKDNSHTLALHTGVDPFYMSKDSFDPIQMFEPKKDITFVNGAPVMTDKLEERYVPSTINNFGDLPFEHNLHVLPGINGVVEEPNAVHRILPKTTNELRSKTNKKVTYNAEKIESGIRSALRANDLNITKFKKSNIKKNSTKNYLPNSSRNNKPSMTGKFRKPNTNRSVSKNVYGHINNSTRGNRRREKHSASSKISYADDSISRSVTNVNNKQFLANKSSYSNTPNERSNSSHNIHGNAHKNTIGSYSIDPKDIPLTTLRQMMIHGDTNIGITKNNNNNNYVFSKDAIIPQTIRSTTSHNTKLGSIKGNNNSYIDNNDKAKNTIRQTTEHMTILGNANPDQHGSYSNNNDPAKNTIRQTTEHMSIIGNANPDQHGSYSNNNDPAKNTVRQTTEHMTILGSANPDQYGSYSNNNDPAKNTIRQTTEHMSILGNANPDQHGSYSNNNDPAKNTIRQTTEHMSIIGNANPDQHGSYSNNNNPAKNTIRQTTEHMSVLGTTKPDQYGLYVNNNDPAKETIKQTTEHMTVLGTANPDQYGLYINNDDPARNTIKQTTEHMSIIGAADPNQHGLYIKNNDTAKNTIRQSTEHMTVTSNLQPSSGAPAYINYLDTPDTTIRNTTELNQYVSNNSRPEGKNPHMYNYDEKAKKTIKQTTLYPTQGGRMQNKANGIGYTRDLDDNAKPTIRQTTLHSTQGGRMQNKTDGIGYSRDLKDNAKITIKQTTLHSSQGGRIGANNKKSSYSIDNKDKARTTIKQTTILKNHIGPLGSNVEKHKNNQAEENMTIDERKQILTYNRFANKKSSNATPCINKKTLKLKEENYLNRENIGYKKESCNIDSLDKMFTRNKKILKDNKNYKITNYRINNDYIDTLKDNPFVNDLMHQKNIDDVETNFIY